MDAKQYADMILRLTDKAGILRTEEALKDHRRPVAVLYRMLLCRAIIALSEEGIPDKLIEGILGKNLKPIMDKALNREADPAEDAFNKIMGDME